MRSAIAFLTIFGRATTPSAVAVRWFPAVGAFLGAVVGFVWWGALELWPALVAAGLVVAADLVLTGLLHLDGLADTGDGLLAPLDRNRRLEILRTPEVGAFGLAAVAIVLGLRWAAVADLSNADVSTLLVLPVTVWASSRAVTAIAMSVLPYARSHGLASEFLAAGGAGRGAGGRRVVDPLQLVAGVATLVLATVAGAFATGVAGVAAVVGTVVGSVAVFALSLRRLHGYTGDVLGAAIVVGETVGLVVAAARW